MWAKPPIFLDKTGLTVVVFSKIGGVYPFVYRFQKEGREKVCEIMENRINEEKIEMAKNEIAYGELTLPQIARAFGLPLAFVQELASKVRPDAVPISG